MMKPIVLIHGYSSEGAGKSVEEIYGNFPNELRQLFGAGAVKELDLSRWISLNDALCLDDVSFAMDRALKASFPKLLQSGFHVVIHSTGALVVRNWIKTFSPKPSPIQNLVHLAGANFGSGLAHIGKGQLARWGRQLVLGTGSGCRILDELEFGSWQTLDLHLHFLQEGARMFEDYQVQEFCIIGSQIPKLQRVIPIRYVKEDSSDGTVRIAGGNLNFNYMEIRPTEAAYALGHRPLERLLKARKEGEKIGLDYYALTRQFLTGTAACREIPFAVPYEIAHAGDDIGIVLGRKNRKPLLGLIRTALSCEADDQAYADAVRVFRRAHDKTFKRIAARKGLLDWNLHEQYEGHAQLVFRIRDQEGRPVEHFDIFMNSQGVKGRTQVPGLIENRHLNGRDKGTITFYLRTWRYSRKGKNHWVDLMEKADALEVEITGEEPLSDDISYVPLNVRLTPKQLRGMIKTFETTVVDVTLLRLPSAKVFAITGA